MRTGKGEHNDQNRHRPVGSYPPARRKPPARLGRTALFPIEGRSTRTGTPGRDRLVRHVRQEGHGRRHLRRDEAQMAEFDLRRGRRHAARPVARSEEHTSELQSLMRISYAVFCLKKKKKTYI